MHNKIKSVFSFAISIILTLPAISQPINKESIKRSEAYYYGEGTSESEQEASDAALGLLTQQIAVTVSSQFERSQFESNGNYTDQMKSVVKSYSGATLRNVHSIKANNDGKINVFLFIERSEVEKIFKERIELVKNIYEKAQDFQWEQDYSNALKWYYFATVLLNSVPVRIVKSGEQNLITEIPAHINTLITSIKFTVKANCKVSDKEREIVFGIYANNKPLQSLEFSFWDGSSQINVAGVDGEAIVHLVGGSIDFTKLDVTVKYSYYECKEEIKEVAELWNVVIKPSFAKSKQVDLRIEEKSAGISGVTTTSAEEKMVAFPSSTTVQPISLMSGHTFRLNNKEDCPVLKEIEQETQNVLSILQSSSLDEVQKKYASDKFIAEKVGSIIRFNKAVPVDPEIKADVNKTSSGWEMRKIRVLNFYKSLNKQSIEYLILDFDTTGKFYDINFGTTDGIYKTFVEQGMYGNDWGNRQIIVKFVERYRTAFLSRDMKMLDSLFADEAVIIIGREMKKAKVKDVYQYSKLNDAQPEYEYMQYTKKQYLKNQEAVFKSQKDVFVGFSTFKISKKNAQENNREEKTYGISMRQNYNSTTYGDEGYLFLLVDFNEKYPQIYVRSWQPHEWNDTAMIKLANFKLNK
ncbi:MAG: hypothetical protein ABR936_13925 [Bacteroidota bacterium]|jgi:hypothetical protein